LKAQDCTPSTPCRGIPKRKGILSRAVITRLKKRVAAVPSRLGRAKNARNNFTAGTVGEGQRQKGGEPAEKQGTVLAINRQPGKRGSAEKRKREGGGKVTEKIRGYLSQL